MGSASYKIKAPLRLRECSLFSGSKHMIGKHVAECHWSDMIAFP